MSDFTDDPSFADLMDPTIEAENVPEAEPMPEGAADAAEAKATADASRGKRQPIQTVEPVAQDADSFDVTWQRTASELIKGGPCDTPPEYFLDYKCTHALRFWVDPEEVAQLIKGDFDYLSLPSSKDYQDAFTMNNLLSYEKSGVAEKLHAKSFPYYFLYIVYTLLKRHKISNGKIVVPLPKILNKLGIDKRDKTVSYRQSRLNAVEEYVYEIEEAFFLVYGLIKGPQGKYYRLQALTVEAFDPLTGVAVLSSPYCAALLKQPCHDFFKAEVLGNRNKVALEVANRICCGFKRRTKKSSQPQIIDGIPYFAYEVTLNRLVKECPQLKYGIEHAPSPQARADFIERTVRRVIEMLKEDTRFSTVCSHVLIEGPKRAKFSSLASDKVIIRYRDLSADGNKSTTK